MKIPVKVKATGDIVDVTISVATAGNPLYTTSGGVTYLGDDIEPAEPDWQSVRIQAAIAAMQSYISDGERMALVSKKFDYDDKIISKFIAEGAVMYADALIAELKKGGEDGM